MSEEFPFGIGGPTLKMQMRVASNVTIDVDDCDINVGSVNDAGDVNTFSVVTRVRGTFGWAIQRMRHGPKVRRPSWPEGLTLTLKGDTIYEHQSGERNWRVWTPDQTAILADDWELVE